VAITNMSCVTNKHDDPNSILALTRITGSVQVLVQVLIVLLGQAQLAQEASSRRSSPLFDT
jgi:hypothetical protein